MITDRPDPLEALTAPAGPASPRELKPGDVLTITTPRGPITLLRTARPYVEDLCEAYNAARLSPAMRWIVTQAGELQLTHDRQWRNDLADAAERRREAERQDWKQRNELPPAAPHWQDDSDEE